MTKHNAAHLLWAVFTDARSYFNTPHDVMGNPPISHLDWMIGGLRGGTIPQTLGTPLISLFGDSRELNPHPSGVGSGGRAEPEVARYQRGSPPPNNNVHARIEAATASARQCNPDVDYRAVMAVAPQPKPRISSLQLNRGGCFNYLFFGKCADPRCSFRHDGEIDESKIDAAIDKMKPGLAKFVERN
jgi:hypothetical protein